MHPTVSKIGAISATPDSHSSQGDFWRVVARCLRYPRSLIVGLLATVGFACLHTVTIGAAFPVFKILLEEEGLVGWSDRTFAGARVDVHFAPLSTEDVIRVVHVDKSSGAFAAGVRDLDSISDTQGRSLSELLHRLATVQDGESIRVRLIGTSLDANSQPREIELKPHRLGFQMRALAWAASFIPPDADDRKIETLKSILWGLVLLVIAGNILRYVGEVQIAKAILRAMMQLRSEVYERTLSLPLAFFSRQPTADIVGRFVQDMQEIQRGMITLFSKFLREPLRAVFIFALALSLDWRITLALVVAAPISFLLFWQVGLRVRKSNRKLLQAYGSMIHALTSSLQSLRVVKSYTAEPRERQILLQVDHRVLRQQIKLKKLEAFVSPAMETVAVIIASVLTVWLANKVLSDELEIATFAALGLALSMLFDPLRKLSDVYVRVQKASAGAHRIFHILNHPTESDLTNATTQLEAIRETIHFDNVRFTYPGATKPAIDGVTLTVNRGETLAIVGPNGCGKTTLVSLLPRFYDPDTGVIQYDGVDLRDADLVSLRKQISLVTQDAVIFAGTPLENIAYGMSEIDEEAVRQAAVRASADEFIRELPGGYQTALGERGTTLSGGQRQRMAIARAILRDAPILIFDEATSQIDTESEQKIQNALREFAKQRTTLIIAHRLSTIQFADRIVVMDSGKIVDSGSHADLLQRCSVYQNLCRTQFGDGRRPE